MIAPGRQSQRRTGMTLYEVVLSLMILLISLAAIGHLISTGSRASVQSRLVSEATLLCQSKLNEVLAGAEPMQSVSQAPLPEASPEWVWSLNVGAGPHPDLFELEVTVSHLGQNGRPVASQSFRRLVRNPQVFVDAAEREAEIEQQQALESGEAL